MRFLPDNSKVKYIWLPVSEERKLRLEQVDTYTTDLSIAQPGTPD